MVSTAALTTRANKTPCFYEFMYTTESFTNDNFRDVKTNDFTEFEITICIILLMQWNFIDNCLYVHMQ